jgi:hypothetical protein
LVRQAVVDAAEDRLLETMRQVDWAVALDRVVAGDMDPAQMAAWVLDGHGGPLGQ